MPFTPPTNHCQTKGFSIIGDIILERIDCFGNKVECGVGLSIALVRLNHHERSPKSLEGRNSHQSFFLKMKRDILETERDSLISQLQD